MFLLKTSTIQLVCYLIDWKFGLLNDFIETYMLCHNMLCI